ncbi:hypothetical protein BpHYR1_043609 [Brachionus plicatilis]|uniref:Uncharacterized protein n=1 Tax=Brachionus plicatilis TaxID=10195 RepID=A0A3M7QAV7_BRAPC|nr:hypothetical protein BpHYR1_043609 [Brachionus plicatilis]
MFYRGEEILSANSKNTPSTTCSNTTNQIIDDKNLILNDFTTNIQQNLITNSSSQESQKNISNSCNQFSNSPKPSSSSSSSSSTTNNYTIPNQEQAQSIKRKSTEPHQPSTYNPKNAYYQKPVYSEILSSKCILYIYYKGDLTSIVDEHFKKSMNASASKSSATLSPLSLSSPSPSIKNAKNSKNSSPTCSKAEFLEIKDSQSWSKSPCQNYDPWLYYSNCSSQMPNNSAQYANHHHDHYWNRPQVDMASFYSNQHYNNYYKFNSTAQFSNCHYAPDTSDANAAYFNSENCNRQSVKNCLKSSVKEEPQINGSFLQAAVAAVINPCNFPTQSGGQGDFCQYNISAPGLSSSSSSLSSLSSAPLTHGLSINANSESMAAAAAVAANQYLSAAAAAASSSPNSYCQGKYHQYFDLSKSTPQIDCRKSSNSNYTTYAYEFANSPTIETNIANNGAGSSFKETSSTSANTQNFATPIWY